MHPSLMNEMLGMDAQLKALWYLRLSVNGSDRQIVRDHIKARVNELRIAAGTNGWVKVIS